MATLHELPQYTYTHCFTADHLLHVACELDQRRVVDYLLTNVHINPNAKNDHEQSPLSLAKSKEVMKLLIQNGADSEDMYTHYRKILGNVFSKDPLRSPMKMFVIGHGGEGKSTLIEAMEHEPTVWSPLVNIFIRPKEVDGVSQRTAGIIPQLFKSRIYGDVLFYDFAGQEAYYSSHAAVIKSAVDTCPPIFILVIGLHRDDTAITHSVSYWLGIITNQCANMEGKAPLIVVGSHADLVSDQPNLVAAKKEVIQQAVQKFISFELVDNIIIDCRYSNSDGMKLLRQCIRTCCTSIQSMLSVSLNSHMLLVYLLEKYPDDVAVTLLQLKSRLDINCIDQELSKKEKAALPFIPTTLPRLIEICKQLSDKGHILFLFNSSSPEKSFIILDKLAALAEINGTVFAPKDFKEHCQLATSTGVVPQSKLIEHFRKYSVDMLTNLLSYLELAVPIDDKEVLKLINEHRTSTGTAKERFLFCPALIRLTVPKNVFKHLPTLSNYFGWVLTCVDADHFFNPRFLHVLILRLALTFGFTPELAIDLPALQRECSVWKNGVCWCSSQGVKVLVEVIDKKQAIVLLQSHIYSAAVLELRSLVIQKVRDAVIEFCPNVVTRELLVDPKDVNYPLNDPVHFSIKSIARSIIKQDLCVVSTSNTELLPVSDLLPVEVYTNLGENILQALCNENDPAHTRIVSDRFLSAVSSVWSKNLKLVDIVCSAIARFIPQTSDINLEAVLKSWRDGSDGTYRSLRLILDQLSVFASQNLLVSFSLK